jgi:Ca-activated chloride channel family protein
MAVLSPAKPMTDSFNKICTVLRSSNKPWALWLAIAAWCFLVLASTCPQWLGEPIEQGVSGRDLMLAVDLSGSMKEQDFIVNNQAVDRLTATKAVGIR